MHYYNEHNAYRAAVLRERIAEGLLPKGVVDERDIEIVPDEDFLGYEQVHLFAGIGGFPLGLRLAGFSEIIRVVDGGFPCQDISNAGKRAGITGTRSRLWREMVRCIRVVRPHLVFVENVAALLCRGMGEVLGDLAEIGYDATGDCVSDESGLLPTLEASNKQSGGVENEWQGAQKLFPDDAGKRTRQLSERQGRQKQSAADADGSGEAVADATERRQPVRWESSAEIGFAERGSEAVADTETIGRDRRKLEQSRSRTDGRADAERNYTWPVEPNVGRVANGVPRRVDRLAALGDAIVPQCAAEAVRRLLQGNPVRVPEK